MAIEGGLLWLRFRSGTYPHEVPTACDLKLHTPDCEGSSPLREPVATEAYLAPGRYAWLRPDGALTTPQLYLAEHLRFERGSGFRARDAVCAAGGTEGTWSSRMKEVAQNIRAVFEEPSIRIQKSHLHTLPSWGSDAAEWLRSVGTGWHRGAFVALAILAEVLCHELERHGEDGLQPWSARCAQSPPRDTLTCAPLAAAQALAVAAARAGSLGSPAVNLILEIMNGCDVATAHGLLAWRWVWRSFASTALVQPGRRATCGAVDSAPEQALPPVLLCAELCEPHWSQEVDDGRTTAHVLSVTMSLQSGGGKYRHSEADAITANSCVAIEVLLFLSGGDSCFVTQAGTVLRCVPDAYLVDWTCKLYVDDSNVEAHWAPAKATANASVVSHFGAVATIRCAFPSSALSAYGAGIHESTAAGPMRLRLDLASALWEFVGVPICAGRCSGLGDARPTTLAPAPPRLLTACTHVMWNATASLHPHGPTLLSQWLDYHLLVGVDHFFIYDSDSSASPVLAKYIAQGIVSYYPQWPRSLSAKLGHVASDEVGCRSCLDMQAEAHCAWRSRGMSRWIANLHGFDAYMSPHPALVRRGGVRPLLAALEPHRDAVGVVPLCMVDVGGSAPTNSSWLIARFQHRQAQPLFAQADLARGSRRETSWLNHFGTTLANPRNLLDIYDHFARSRPGAIDVEIPWLQLHVKHYVDALSERCSQRSLPCTERDSTMLWALEHMMVAAGARL